MSLDRSSGVPDGELDTILRERLLETLTTEIDADLVEYECPHCQERCINPHGSVLEEAGVCLDCHVHYATEGHLRGRIFSRWD